MAKSAAKIATAKGKGGGLALKLALGALGLASLAVLPLFLVIVPGMMPTLVTLFVDRQRPRHLTYTVGVMNFAGVLPILLTLAKGHLSVQTAAAVLADPTVWLVMYGAAATGWLICAAMSPLARLCLELQAAQKRRALEALAKAIRQEWGEEVAGGPKNPPAGGAQPVRDSRP
jgi:hypothetical protein